MAQAFRSTRVLLPGGLTAATVIAEDGRIAAVLGWDDSPVHAVVHDFGEALLLPGLVDSHVHINEPGRTEWEGFWAATRAAASGGVTTLVDMPLNCIPETTDCAALEAKRAAAKAQSWVDWAAWGGVVHGNADDLPPLAAAGVPGFKCFLIHSGIDGFAWVDEAQLRLALARIKKTGLPLLVHAEVAEPVERATQALNSSTADWRHYSTYLASRPDEAETVAVALLIRLADEFDTPIHVVHLSTAKALPMLAEARLRGVPITVETCVQYLWFAAEDIPDGATEWKCAPPIRGKTNREALWAALHEGLIDMVTTDHSPCPPEFKRRQEGRWDLAWGGIAGLGLALPVMWTALTRRGVTVEAAASNIARWMSSATAGLAGLSGKKGALVVGADADFAVFDPDHRWTVTREDLQFRHKLSPYIGAELRGRVLETWLRGKESSPMASFPSRRRAESWCAHDGSRAESDCRMPPHCNHDRGAGANHSAFLTAPMRNVHACLRSRMEALGMSVHLDAAGNLRGLWNPPAATSKRLLLGSHIDTVPGAGAFDGVLGVALALEWVDLARELVLPIAIEVIAFSEEEGVRYGVPFLGSRAVAGRFDPALLSLEDEDGISVAAALHSFGLNPDQMADAEVGAETIGFVEIHIEQGPTLEAEGLSIAAVTAIVGQTRLSLTFGGQANHAGTTPMHLRQDALAGAAEWVIAVEALAVRIEGIVATVGRIVVEPNAGNVVAGRAQVSLDLRHDRDSVRAAAVEELVATAGAIAARRGLTLERADRLNQPAVPMDERLTNLLTDSIAAAGYPAKTMPSGAGHDAMVMAAKIPTAMLFLRTPGGISHHPAESVLEQDVAASLLAGREFLIRASAIFR